MNTLHTGLAGLAALAALCPAPAAAADGDSSELVVTITGARSEQPLAHATAPITVIDRTELDQSQAMTLNEALAGHNGIAAASNGGAGKVTNLYLRGANAGQTLLLVDGIRLGSSTLGSPAWQLLPLGLAERIEVVRGAQSGLYGSDAIGGVVQVLTLPAPGSPVRPWAEAGLGTQQGRHLGAGVRGSQGATTFSLGGDWLSSDGFDATATDTFAHNDDRDGFRSGAGHVAVRQDVAPGQSFSFTALRAQGENRYDGSNPLTFATADHAEGKFVQQVLALNADNRLTDAWRMKTTLGQSRDQNEDFADGLSAGAFDTRRDQFTWQHEFRLADGHLLSLGAEWLHEKVGGSGVVDYAQKARTTRALFLVDAVTLGAHDLQLSLRSDDIDDIGRHNTGRLGWGWSFASGLRATASYATGFKAPTFNDLYYPAGPFAAGNPDLEPESSHGWDLGLEQHAGAWHWRLGGYRTRVGNLIQWVPDEFFRFSPVNVANARLTGIEASLGWQDHGWQVNLDADWLRAEDTDSGDPLPNRPNRSARLSIDYAPGTWSAGATLLAAAYPDDLPQRGWSVLDLRSGYRLDKDFELKLKVNNVFDRDYQTVNGYPMPGREAWIAIEYGMR